MLLKTMYLAMNDLRVFLSRPSNYINIFVMPIILALVLGAAFNSGGVNYIRVDVVDFDKSELSNQFITLLRNTNEYLVLCPIDEGRLDDYDCELDGEADLTLDASLQRVEDKVVTASIIIPEGYEDKFVDFVEVSIDYYATSDMTQNDPVLPSVQSVVQRVNGIVVASRVGMALGKALNVLNDANQDTFFDAIQAEAAQLWQQEKTLVRYVVSGKGEQQGVSMGFSQSVPGMATMYVMFTALGGLSLLIEERRQWTLQRLVMMPIRRVELLSGKVIARFILGMITFGALVIVGILTGVNWGANPLAIILIMVSYTLCIVALTFAIAPFMKSDQQAASVSVLFSITLSALGGAWWPLEIVPNFMKIIGHFSPVAWAMDGFSDILFYNRSLIDILPEVGVLLLISLVLFVYGLRNFKYEV